MNLYYHRERLPRVATRLLFDLNALQVGQEIAIKLLLLISYAIGNEVYV
jgi:hypothetical protein